MSNAKKQRKTIEWESLGDIKGKFLERMCAIKNRNSTDLTEAEKIKKRWQEYTEEPYNKRS